MSNQAEIARLETARDTIRDKLVDFGIATDTDKLDVLAEKLDAIPNNSYIDVVQLDTENRYFDIPEGYYDGFQTVEIILEEKTVTPNYLPQIITPTAGKVLSGVKVNPIPDKYHDVSDVDATAQQVLEGFTIVDAEGNIIEGTMTDHGDLGGNITIDAENYYYDIPEGYHNGGGSVNVMLEEKTVTPTDTQQIITPSAGKVLSKVIVEAASGGGGGGAVSPSEDLDQVLMEQEIIIYELKSVLESKASGSGGEVGTCTVTLYLNTLAIVSYTDGTDLRSERMEAGEHTLEVPKNSIFILSDCVGALFADGGVSLVSASAEGFYSFFASTDGEILET